MNDFLNTVDPTTGLTLLQTLLQTAVMIISILIGIFLTWLVATLRKVLPAYLSAMIGEQQKQDVHDAAMTIVRNILLEGKDPRGEVTRILDYMRTSAKDAFTGALKKRTLQEVTDIWTDIALSKVAVVEGELTAGKSASVSPRVPVLDAHSTHAGPRR